MATIHERITQHQFSTVVSIVDDDIFAFEKHKIINRINSSRNPLSLNPVVIVADPFLFVHKEELFLFYEEQVGLNDKGVIKMTKTLDLKNWTKPVMVLEEDFHLSYPNVFEVDGQIYMMPETGNATSIRLYTPNNELTQWTFTKNLLTGKHFADSDIVFYNGNYFLFTTDYTNKTNVLELFWSDSFNGEWFEHPQSPIAEGKNTGRCGGSIFNYNNKLYRPTQLAEKRYGEGLDLYQIKMLNKNEFIEERIKTIIPNANRIYREGGHHFNFCKFNNQNIVATDVFELKINYWKVANQLTARIKS